MATRSGLELPIQVRGEAGDCGADALSPLPAMGAALSSNASQRRPPSYRRTGKTPRTRSRSGTATEGEAAESVTTVVRLRPLLAHERGKDSDLGLSVHIEPPDRVLLTDPQQKQQARLFDCSVALDSSDPASPDYADQQAVYSSIGAQLVEQALQGYNCCVCAYGQTGTGKTHTLHGDWHSVENRGLLPRVALGLLSRCEGLRDAGAEVRLQASYIEIYNNRLIDLLAPADSSSTPGDRKKHGRLNIHTHPAIGVYVENLSQIPVQSLRDVGRLLAVGEQLRHTATTSMNQRSSRSHTIFSFKLEVRNGTLGEGARMATVQVADLAGRENEQTSECTGERFRELTFINRSLFQLANCVHALSDGKREHVPFRDSKLTMLLSESFQRNSRTCLLATLTPSASGYEENLLTCRFLESTGRIQTQPVVNRFSSEDLSAKLQAEIEHLRQQLGLQSYGSMSTHPELEASQLLLRHLSGGLLAGTAAAHSAQALARQERAKEALVRDACSRVGRSLDSTTRGLTRLDATNASLGTALGSVDSRLAAVEAAVKELRPSVGSRGKTHMLKGVREEEAEMYRGAPRTAPSSPPGLRLPPIFPVGGKLSRPAPVVSFSLELPPIVFL